MRNNQHRLWYVAGKEVLNMFLAMNRFRIAPGMEAGFEKIWRERESFLEGVPGFVSFALLKGSSDDEQTLYASHSVWETRAAFEAWTESENFRRAHAQTSAPKGTYLGHPDLELFEQVL
ncbi:MAG: antibiotic biosynthesis monooxygenase [Pseudomonadales bacterium]